MADKVHVHEVCTPCVGTRHCACGRVMLTRRERRIERMRTQRIGHAERERYVVSGRPTLAQSAIWREVQR